MIIYSLIWPPCVKGAVSAPSADWGIAAQTKKPPIPTMGIRGGFSRGSTLICYFLQMLRSRTHFPNAFTTRAFSR